MEPQSESILYQPDNEIRLEVRLEDETAWLTQAQIAVLFGTKRPAITKHLNNIYNSGELDRSSTCSILEHIGNEGKQIYATQYYNLDAILSVGYRVNSKNATLFRRWANKILKEYLLKGYSVNHRLTELEHTVAEHSKKIDFFVRTYRQCHDRFLIIDNTEVYHIGASLKDLGRKMFAFCKMNIPAEEILNKVNDSRDSLH